MKRFFSFFVLAAALLVAAGCASYDDTTERAEFEKLRSRPVTPHGDPVLPSFEWTPSSDDSDSQKYAFHGRTLIPLSDRVAERFAGRHSAAIGSLLSSSATRVTRVS